MEIDGDINEWYYKQILNCQHNKTYLSIQGFQYVLSEELALAICPLKNTFFTKTSLTRYFNQTKTGN